MSETPETKQPAKKRRWFQFHLSTLVLLTFTAGGLAYMNMTEDRYEIRFWGGTQEYPVAEAFPSPGYRWGWPWVAYRRHPLHTYDWTLGKFRTTGYDCGVQWKGLFGNILCAILILTLVGIASELLICLRIRTKKGE